MKIEKRKEIAKRFLQTLLWIDDEITVNDATNIKFDTFFKPASEAIIQQGVICQLFGFPNITASDAYGDDLNPIIETIGKLIQKTDVIILDWHLGADDSSNSERVISQILRAKGTRFCVILSQDPNLETAFQEKYSQLISCKEGYWASNDGSKFFILFHKSTFEEFPEKDLFPTIIATIADTYKDYIHWAAIEIMANIKDEIPTLLASLPKDTDNALMAEGLLQGANNELNSTLDFTVSAIGEDLYDLVTEMNLISVKTCVEQFEMDDSYQNLKKSYSSELTKECTEIAEAIKNKTSEFPDLCLGYSNLTKLFEQKSLSQTLSKKVFQGAVYSESGVGRKILICISQPCDCNSKNHVLLLKAELDPKFKRTAAGKTHVTFNDKTYVIIPEASSCITCEVIEPKGERHGLKGMNYLGGLRSSVVMRIADRFFSHQTRVGVNQPRIIRDLRQNL